MNNKNNNPLRLFVSIDMPIEVQEIISAIQHQLKQPSLFVGTFVKPAHAHLTMQFLGSIEENKVPAIIQALEEIQMPAISVCVGSLGVFPSARHINIIYVDLLNPSLSTLVQTINNHLADFVAKEERPWVSHVTLARIKKVHDRLSLLSLLEAIKIPNVCFEVREFLLKQSILSSEGPSYTTIARFTLQ